MKRKLDKNKVYAFIGRATVKLTAWVLSVYATYGISLWILNDCITVYRQEEKKMGHMSAVAKVLNKQPKSNSKSHKEEKKNCL